MGPERKAPENLTYPSGGVPLPASFNEAGAKGSGKQAWGQAQPPWPLLQWGRSERLRKTALRFVRAAAFPASMGPERKAPENPRLDADSIIEYLKASMGPERKAPENGERMRILELEIQLQWGRSERLRKTVYPSEDRDFTGTLQWGRSERLRKTTVSAEHWQVLRHASMGPERKAPENSRRLGSWRPSLEASMGPERKAPENTQGYSGSLPRYKLQWGRSERLRKTENRIHELDEIEASMGPERKAPENAPKTFLKWATSSLQWGRSERLRKTGHNLGEEKPDAWLQWGRSERLRKTAFDLGVKFATSCASMGPERKAPENKMDDRWKSERNELQWGRSERLRKTSPECPRLPGPTRFNGAGAKGSGKPAAEKQAICLSAELQWGRSERLRKTGREWLSGVLLDLASMGPERKAPENTWRAYEEEAIQEASMGPERKAPENAKHGLRRWTANRSFNGAGAKGSGKQGYRRAVFWL